VVTKPDRLARSTAELLSIEADLSKRGIGLVVLSMGGEKLDTRNPTSKLILTILAGVATWEREVMLERQREGIAKAKSEGKYKGRKPTARAKADQITTLAAEGMTREAIAAQLEVGVASVYRVLSAGARLTGFRPVPAGSLPSGRRMRRRVHRPRGQAPSMPSLAARALTGLGPFARQPSAPRCTLMVIAFAALAGRLRRWR
jgi:hypothetical protein